MTPARRGRSGSDWPEYRPRRPGPSAPRAAGRRPFGQTWWGRSWIDALEHRAQLDPNRLPRGRTYARSGAVGELRVEPGEVTAPVQGSRSKPYAVRVRIRPYSPDEWDRVVGALAAEIGHTAALMEGELLPEIREDVRSVGLDLLPGAGEVQPRCTCPDWADPCKHAAAVCYLVADALDENPFVLFELRGRSRDEVLAAVRGLRSPVADGSPALGDEGALDDPGVVARDAWARSPAALPRPPLPPRRAGRPTVLGVDPPSGMGIDAARLRDLAADAAQRALGLAMGGDTTGLELSEAEDLARRAAALLGPGPGRGGELGGGRDSGGEPGSGRESSGDSGGEPGADQVVGTRTADIGGLARAAGIPPRQLLGQALAWRAGGPDGLAAMSEPWDPPAGEVTAGRALLGPRATVRRNRVTLGDRQLRLGRDRRWYPFRRVAKSWDPDGPPLGQPGPDGVGSFNRQ